MADVSLTFGPYELLASRRQLLRQGVVLPVGSRAFDILLALVERPGQPVSSADLISQVWQQRVVHPGALRVHIAALRRTLEDDRAHPAYIGTTPSGYRFVAPVLRSLPPQAATERSRWPGRSAAIAELSARIQTHRCITVTGPGGAGKSAVAHALVQRCREQGREVHVVDLATCPHPADVLPAIAAALGIPVAGPDRLAALVDPLRDAEFVLVLDNCEHVIAAAARCSERILMGAARVAVVATSREPLRIPGEWVHRLVGPALPPDDDSPAMAGTPEIQPGHFRTPREALPSTARWRPAIERHDMSGTLLRFDAFELQAEPLRLLEDGEPCSLGDKALRILRALVERAGSLVSHEELLRQVWPAGDIGRGNLRVHVHALQKTLGLAADGRPRILNQPGQGYRFVHDAMPSGAPSPQAASGPLAHGRRVPPLPARWTRLIGRDGTIAAMVDAFASTRALVITGAGGSGKTSTAVALAERLAPGFRDGPCLVDLSTCDEGHRVAAAVAAALGLPIAGEDPERELVDALRGLQCLLLLDHCEHLGPDVARLGNRVLDACPRVKLIVASRSAVRVDAAHAWRLQPLALPAEGAPPADALSSPAVQLFMDRASDALPPGPWQPQVLGDVVELCRRLDGLPLAIELAATHARTLGFEALRDAPHDRLLGLPIGSRTNPRHESLRALLDHGWSLLDDDAAGLLARLAVFRDVFDIDGAAALARAMDLTIGDTMALLERLVDGSWLVAERHQSVWRYRMLETTRLHALTRLRERGSERRTRQDHATHLCLRLQASDGGSALPEDATPSWAIRPVSIDDVRSALDWFSDEPGDGALVAELTIASAPLWSGASRLGLFAARVASALCRLQEEELGGGEQEMRLRMLKAALEFNAVATSPERTRALHRALFIARERGARGVEMTALWNMMRMENLVGNYDAMNGYIDQIVALADTDDEFETALVFRLRALAESRCGRLKQSLMFGKAAIRSARAQASSHRARLGYDPHAAAMANQALTLFLLGRTAESRDCLNAALAGMSSMRNPSSLCYILADNAIPLAVWAGDLALAQARIARLAETAHEHGFPFYSDLAHAHALALQVLQDPSCARLTRARPAFARQHQFHKELLITIAPGLVDAVSLDRARRGQSGWSSAEILRAAALHPASACLPATADVRHALLGEAAATAARQGAAAWEIRALEASLPVDADATACLDEFACISPADERHAPRQARH